MKILFIIFLTIFLKSKIKTLYQPNGNNNEGIVKLNGTLGFYGIGFLLNEFSFIHFYNNNLQKISLKINVLKNIGINPTCKNAKNGSIQVKVEGGIPPFTYTWDNPNLSSSFLQNIGAGIYKLTVTDAHGSSKTETFVLTEPEEITATFDIVGAKCNQANGFVTINTKGGTPPYFYNSNPSNIIGNLSSGITSILIRDSKGCVSQNYQITISDTGLPQFTLTPNSTLCQGNTMVLSAKGTDNTYLWSTGETTADITISPIFTSTYSVTVTNNVGCTLTGSTVINVKSATKPIIQSAGGALATNATGAIQWFFNGVPIVGQTNFVFAPTKSGIYSVQNTENGCSTMSDPFAFTYVSESNVSEIKNVIVFPNPIQDKFAIKNVGGRLFKKIAIFNEEGKSLGEYDFDERLIFVSCNEWSNGMYFIYFYNNKNEVEGISKLIKQ